MYHLYVHVNVKQNIHVHLLKKAVHGDSNGILVQTVLIKPNNFNLRAAPLVIYLLLFFVCARTLNKYTVKLEGIFVIQTAALITKISSNGKSCVNVSTYKIMIMLQWNPLFSNLQGK